MQSFFAERRPHRGLTYEDYLAGFEQEAARYAALDPAALDEKARDHAHYVALNLQRTRRIGKTYAPSEEARALLGRLAAPQLWMVLTEIWCGDSAQSLPYVARVAALSPLVDLRILARDENLDIMDAYLTAGGRAIPKLVAFDAQGGELFQWGPRPRPASELFAREKAAGLPKEEILRKLHQWYGADRGRSIEAELLECLRPWCS